MVSSSNKGANYFLSGQGLEPTRILVIDDDVETTELIKIILDPENFEVIATNSGLEGLDMLNHINPSVVVLDLMMPEIDGFSLCKKIREFSQVPILVLSAVNKPGIIAQALETGADDYLNKPIKSNLLIAHLHKLARRSKSSHTMIET